MYSKTQVRLKFYLNKILKMKKSIEAQGFLILPSYSCFTLAQEKFVERELTNRGIIKEIKHGGKWNYDFSGFEKNIYEVNWNQLEVEYYGWLQAVTYVDLVKVFNATPIKRSSNKPLLKVEDLKIKKGINKRIPEGVTPQDLIDCLNEKYPMVPYIQERLKELNQHLTVENKFEWTLDIKGDVLERVGLRMTNSLVSLKKADGSRTRYLESQGLHKNPNGDIKSEIPRVTCLLNNKEWKPFSFDFYSQFLKRDKIPDMLRSELVKPLFMPLYFTNWSTPQAFANREIWKLDDKYRRDDIINQTKRMLEMLKEGFDRLCGESYNSEIFYYTSILEFYALAELVERYPNARFFQVYDEIFSDVDIPDMEEVYARAAAQLSKIKEEEFKLCRLEMEETRNGDGRSGSGSGMELSLVSKMQVLNSSSSSLKFEERRGGAHTTGKTWNWKEEAKAKLRVPKSEETKAKIKAVTNKDAEYVEFVREILQDPTYINLSKKRAKQQYIDAKLIAHFGSLSSTTLTKIRKLVTSTSKEN